MVRHLLSLDSFSAKHISSLISFAAKVKKNPKAYKRKLEGKTLLNFFEMPSLRTEISFHVAMNTLGGDEIDYHAEHSPWGKGKESTSDVGNVLSRYIDCIMVRIHDHAELIKLSEASSVPVINGLTSFSHPCQILSDLLTIKEKFGKLKGLTLCYLGDSFNNVTHSLLFGCSLMEMDVSIGCPSQKAYSPDPAVVRKAKKLGSGRIIVTSDPLKAAKNADIVYTDSWMSYRIDAKQKAKRLKILKKYQVTSKVMKAAKRKAAFMHCLPATRGHEVTASVIDSKQSIVFDQAENRLHMQKVILLDLLGKK